MTEQLAPVGMTPLGDRARVAIGASAVLIGALAFGAHMLAVRLSTAKQQVIDLRAQVSALQSHIDRLESPHIPSVGPVDLPRASTSSPSPVDTITASSPAQALPAQKVIVSVPQDRWTQPSPGKFDGANDSNAGAQVSIKHGTEKFMARDFAGAESDYRDAIRLDPYSSDALAALGTSQVSRGEIADAENSYTKALQLHNNLHALNGLAGIRYHQNRFQEAYHLEETVLAQDPHNRSGVWLTALILDGLHQPDAALRMYQRFLEIDPNSNAAIYARDKLQTADAGKPATHSSKP